LVRVKIGLMSGLWSDNKGRLINLYKVISVLIGRMC